MSNKDSDIQNLTGRILLSTPSAREGRVNKSMIFICEHGEKGAMGVTINKILPELNLISILNKFDDSLEKELIIHLGGDKSLDKCFILHTNETQLFSGTRPVHNNLFLTISDDILKSLTFLNKNPERKILCVGCCTWEAFQLEEEVSSNYWIPIVADEALIFGDPHIDKWSKAFLKIGLNSSLFLDKTGNA